MDFFAVTYRNSPYIDGEKYPRMCFTCAHVPKDRIQKYDEQGNLVEDIGQLFSYKYLYTAEELVEMGSCETLASAKRCVRAVKLRLKEVGKKALSKLKLRRPDQHYEINQEHEEQALAKKMGRKSKRQPELPKPKPKLVDREQGKLVKEPTKKPAKKLVKKPRLAAKKIRRG
jgi:hypothetical protein